MHLPPAKRSAPENTHAFVHKLLGDDVHATRVLSLANGVVGVMHAAALGIHAIGRGLADALELDPKHAIKQVDRLLSNQGIEIWAWFSVGFVRRCRPKRDSYRFGLDGVRQGRAINRRALSEHLSRSRNTTRVENHRKGKAQRSPRRIRA